MNEKNLDYLKNSLKYLGFGDKLNSVLENAIRQELPKFTLSLSNSVSPADTSKDNHLERDFINYNLSFSKSKDSDMYFLNNYQAKLQKPNTPEREHSFTLSSGNSTTAKEAYNLLSGRSVNKDISTKEGNAEKVNVWTKLDLEVKDAHGNYPVRNFYPNYGFDLEKALSKYPIPNLNDAEKKSNLFASLKKGDLSSADLMINGKKTSVFISANPEMKGVDIFDKKAHPIRDYHIWPELLKEQKDNLKASQPVVEKNRGKADKDSSAQQPVKPWEQDASESKGLSIGR